MAAGAEAGFTLVEVLCALSIAALGLVMVMQMLAASERAARRLGDDFAVRAQLRSLMALDAMGSGGDAALGWRVSSAPGPAILPAGFPFQLSERRLTVTGRDGHEVSLGYFSFGALSP